MTDRTYDADCIYEACVQAVSEADGPDAAARAVIQTIIDLTPSPRTVDELTRILAQANG